MTNLQETLVQLDASGISLEARLGTSNSNCGAVITHPHPQYGGNMDNPVVETIARAYQSSGWTTLRFNFRGAGNSQGAYDNGIGEQKDIDAAIAHLAAAGMQTIELAGYSFGAWVVSLWAQHNANHDHVLRMVAPPVAFMDYQAIGRIHGLDQVLVGSRDEIAPAAAVRGLMPAWQPDAGLHLIEDADHFFSHHLSDLQAALEQAIAG